MKTTCFDLTVKDNIAHLVLNRPDKRNAMIREFWTELPSIVHKLDRQAKARVLVISSTGPHFTSGIDVSMFSQTESDDPDHARRQKITHGARFYSDVKQMQQTFSALADARFPVIAAIQGGCIGGGVDLATACCMRYATSDAYFTVYETNIAMTADVGTFPRLVRLIPEGLARELAYTGRKFKASEALQTGLVNQVFDSHADMLDQVMNIAAQIASKAPMAVYGCKRMISYAQDHSTQDTLDYVGLWNASFLQREEIAEAMTSAAEKRPGNFVDLPVMGSAIGGTDVE